MIGSNTAAVYDIARDPLCDFTSKRGFLVALSYMLSLQIGGLIMAGPPCSLFVFLSSSVHKRSTCCPEGDTSNASVRMANLIVRNLAVLLRLATSRGVHWVVEQPGSSKLWGLQTMKTLFAQCEPCRVFTYMGCFGHSLNMLKPTVLWGTVPTLHMLARTRKQCPMEESSGRAGKKIFYFIGSDGRVTGGPDLHESAAYPALFAKAVFEAWGAATASAN